MNINTSGLDSNFFFVRFLFGKGERPDFFERELNIDLGQIWVRIREITDREKGNRELRNFGIFVKFKV